MIKHIRYGLAALLVLIAISLLMQCRENEEIIPTGNCKPEKCEFRITEHIRLVKR